MNTTYVDASTGLAIPNPTDWQLMTANNIMDWCKSQHFSHNYEGMHIIGLSLISFGVYFASKYALDNLEMDYKTITNVEFINDLSLHFSFWLIIGFAVYWRWFQVK